MAKKKPKEVMAKREKAKESKKSRKKEVGGRLRTSKMNIMRSRKGRGEGGGRGGGGTLHRTANSSAGKTD